MLRADPGTVRHGEAGGFNIWLAGGWWRFGYTPGPVSQSDVRLPFVIDPERNEVLISGSDGVAKAMERATDVVKILNCIVWDREVKNPGGCSVVGCNGPGCVACPLGAKAKGAMADPATAARDEAIREIAADPTAFVIPPVQPGERWQCPACTRTYATRPCGSFRNHMLKVHGVTSDAFDAAVRRGAILAPKGGDIGA